MTNENLAAKFGLKSATEIDPKRPVLVVDNQQDLRLIVSHHLAKLQFNKVIQVTSGIEALEAIHANKEISAIICDMDMPNMNGLELIQELREDINANRVPFCLTMMNVSKEKIMLGVEYGVDEILVKPYTLGDIIPKIRSAFKIFHNPNNPEPVYELAKQLIRAGKLDKAAAIYTDLIKTADGSARPHVGLARIAERNNDFDAALENLKKAEEQNSNYVHIFSLRGDIMAAQENWDSAIVEYRRGIELSPLNPIRYINAVQVLMKQKKYSESMELLKVAIKRDLKFPDLYASMSQASYHLKDYKVAIRYVKLALQNDPENLNFMNQLAISYKESGQFEDAQRTYNGIIKIDPDNLPALFNKAIMLEKKENIDGAIKILQRIMVKHPDFDQGKSKLKQLEEKLKPAA